MKAICVIPKGTLEGNLIWRVPYIYPEELLEEGIKKLKEISFYIENLEDEIGIAFKSDLEAEKALHEIRIAFGWMDITFYDNESKIDFEEALLNYATVALPLSRLRIENSIITDHICLFPPGLMWINNVHKFDGSPFESNADKGSKDITVLHREDLRDHITSITNVTLEVFQCLPIMVFSIRMSYKEYREFNQMEDVDLIRKCSDRAESVMDLLRFYNGDYIVPEALPARSGIWNDRHSAMYIFFPKEQVSHIQSREVELKTFIKGIGMDIYDTNNITLHPLMWKYTNELQNIIKHALRMNSAIMEEENETMKFAQIMILFEYIGDPNRYGNFQDMKAKFVGTLAKDKNDYHRLSERFHELTGGSDNSKRPSQNGLRTKIVHLGKSVYVLVPNAKERKALFQELHGYIYTLIMDMMLSDTEAWVAYNDERTKKKDELLC